MKLKKIKKIKLIPIDSNNTVMQKKLNRITDELEDSFYLTQVLGVPLNPNRVTNP